MKFEIIWATNGKIIKIHPENEDEETYIISEETDDEYESFKKLFWELLQYCGPSDSKYSEKRLKMVVMPGSDYQGTLEKTYRDSLVHLRDELNTVLKFCKEEKPVKVIKRGRKNYEKV